MILFSSFIQCEQRSLKNIHNFVNVQQFEQAEKDSVLGMCIVSMQVQTQLYCLSYLNTIRACAVCPPHRVVSIYPALEI